MSLQCCCSPSSVAPCSWAVTSWTLYFFSIKCLILLIALILLVLCFVWILQAVCEIQWDCSQPTINWVSLPAILRVSCLQEELVSLRLQCSSVYRKGHFSQSLSSTGAEHTSQRATDGGLTLGQTLLGAVGAVGAALLRQPMGRSQLVAMSSSEDEGSLRFIYELLGWVEEMQVSLSHRKWRKHQIILYLISGYWSII